MTDDSALDLERTVIALKALDESKIMETLGILIYEGNGIDDHKADFTSRVDYRDGSYGMVTGSTSRACSRYGRVHNQDWRR